MQTIFLIVNLQEYTILFLIGQVNLSQNISLGNSRVNHVRPDPL